MAGLEDDVAGCDMNHDAKIYVRDVLKHLSASAKEVAEAAMEMDTGFVNWCGRRDWARKTLRIRYKKLQLQNCFRSILVGLWKKNFQKLQM